MGMGKFDLELFKNGRNAVTRNGAKVEFVGICEECEEAYELSAHIIGELKPISYYIDGTLNLGEVGCLDLVSMEGPIQREGAHGAHNDKDNEVTTDTKVTFLCGGEDIEWPPEGNRITCSHVELYQTPEYVTAMCVVDCNGDLKDVYKGNEAKRILNCYLQWVTEEYRIAKVNENSKAKVYLSDHMLQVIKAIHGEGLEINLIKIG